MTRKRTVHVGINVSLDLPNTWRLYAECDDEETSVIFTGEPLFTLPTTEAELLSSGFAEVLLAEHAAHCGACRRWAVPSDLPLKVDLHAPDSGPGRPVQAETVAGAIKITDRTPIIGSELSVKRRSLDTPGEYSGTS